MDLNRQAQRIQEAEAERQRSCANSATQECSDMTSKAQSEASLYQSLQERYRQCLLRTNAGNPFSIDPFPTHPPIHVR
jgi:uncharacterized protein involved in exopolysaccharide biosynthesis